MESKRSLASVHGEASYEPPPAREQQRVEEERQTIAPLHLKPLQLVDHGYWRRHRLRGRLRGGQKT